MNHMAELDPRPLSARLDAYIANLLSIADQLSQLGDTLDERRLDSEPIRSGVKLYLTIADDLTKIVNGEKLAPFEVTGEL